MPEIVNWAEISDQFSEGLLLGNGASIAVHDGFHYDSLYEAAQASGHLSDAAVQIFEAFEVTDFEFVLRRLWHAQLVNQALGVEHGRVEDAYQEVRTALIATIRSNHVSYENAAPHLSPIYLFMKQFKTVLSLNYDLLVYWAMMAGNNELDYWFKDAFRNGFFRENWEEVREPFRGAGGSTLVFYPHGNLVLARKSQGNEEKLRAGSDSDLLNAILSRWENGNVVPLIVSEGTTEQKRRSIESSSYIHRVYREVIPDIGSSLVVYGWSASEQDRHILDRLKHSELENVAISVHGNDQAYMERVYRSFNDIGVDNVLFFDSESPGCWIHQEETE